MSRSLISYMYYSLIDLSCILYVQLFLFYYKHMIQVYEYIYKTHTENISLSLQIYLQE